MRLARWMLLLGCVVILAAPWRRRAPSTDESLAEARRAMLHGDWDRARDLALDVEHAAQIASELRREAEHRREERSEAAAFLAAAHAGDTQRALTAYDHLDSGSPEHALHSDLYASLRRSLLATQRQSAEHLLAAHDCTALKAQLDDRDETNQTLKPAVTILLARCYEVRTVDDLLRTGETTPRELSDAEKLQLLGVRGESRPRALRLLGTSACAGPTDAANRIWHSLDAAGRRAFAAGCALVGETLPRHDPPPEDDERG